MGATCSSESSTASTFTAAEQPGAAISPQLLELLGPEMLTKNGKVPTATALAGKSVALYFSAHWCPPCRHFTPRLADAYTKHLRAKNLEVIFVSSDQNEQAFKSYFNTQPWLAMPFNDRSRKAALGQKFGVRGIPSLILIDEHGGLISADGRSKVMSDPTGKWVRAPPAAAAAAAKPAAAKPPPTAATPANADAKPGDIASVLGSKPLLATDGKTPVTPAAAVKDAPLVGLYFSAHWCGPCRSFTPKLITFVEMLEEEGVHLPIVFGSSDRDEPSMQSYFKEMPWLAFPHGDSRIEALKAKYQVSGIPWLVILDADGNLVVNEADTDVPKGPQAYAEWLAKAKRAAAKPMAGAPAA